MGRLLLRGMDDLIADKVGSRSCSYDLVVERDVGSTRKLSASRLIRHCVLDVALENPDVVELA